jgi:drug/metabolite transporter (DMT)-like permease
MPKSNIKDYLHLHFIVFIWGFTAVLGKLITIDAIPLVWFRLSIASIVLFFFLLVKKVNFKINLRAFILFLIGGFLIGLHWIAFFYAIKVSTVSVTLATLATGALFTSILEPLFFKTKFKFYEIILSLLTVIGIIIIFNVEPQYGLGIIVALIAAFLSALFAVVNAGFVKDYDSRVISFYELLFAVLLISAIILFNDGFSKEFFNLSNNDWGYILILGSVCTAYALTASTELLNKISPFTMMLTVNLEPVYGIILALIVFGNDEKMNPSFYYGAVLIFIGVILNGIIKAKGIKKV